SKIIFNGSTSPVVNDYAIATITVPENINGLKFYLTRDRSNSNYVVPVKEFKIEKGTKATDWTPAPEDTDAKITSNTTLIEQNADGLKLKANQDTVDTLEGTISSLGTEVNAVAGQISNKVWKTDIETAIDGIEVGGRNYFVIKDLTPKPYPLVGSGHEYTYNLKPNTTYTISTWNTRGTRFRVN